MFEGISCLPILSRFRAMSLGGADWSVSAPQANPPQGGCALPLPNGSLPRAGWGMTNHDLFWGWPAPESRRLRAAQQHTRIALGPRASVLLGGRCRSLRRPLRLGCGYRAHHPRSGANTAGPWAGLSPSTFFRVSLALHPVLDTKASKGLSCAHLVARAAQVTAALPCCISLCTLRACCWRPSCRIAWLSTRVAATANRRVTNALQAVWGAHCCR